jgi:hypothetical protein
MGRHGEAIEYDGIRWNPCARDPYYRSGDRGLLHRWMWTKEVGPIPEGMQVHHKNHDKRDNRVDNFVLLSPGEHWAEHGEERGSDWHSRGGKAAWAKVQVRDFICERCGEGFQSRNNTKVVRFCSNACREAAAPSRALEQRVCRVCGNSYECPRRNPTTTCSRKCTAAYIAEIKRGKSPRSDGRARA